VRINTEYTDLHILLAKAANDYIHWVYYMQRYYVEAYTSLNSMLSSSMILQCPTTNQNIYWSMIFMWLLVCLGSTYLWKIIKVQGNLFTLRWYHAVIYANVYPQTSCGCASVVIGLENLCVSTFVLLFSQLRICKRNSELIMDL